MSRADEVVVTNNQIIAQSYGSIRTQIVELLHGARAASARSVNALMTATCWETGRRIVEFEQSGNKRAEYGEELIKQLAGDLTWQFGRGFGAVNLSQMRRFYMEWPPQQIFQTLSEKSLPLPELATKFPLPWSAYVRLLSVKSPGARSFYETEALRSGWSVRQFDRQIGSQFYERLALSHNKAALLEKEQNAESGDAVTPEEAIKDPFVLEFLDLKDEYSESDLEEALILNLTDFLLELGDDFAFLGGE
jgi:predicted nuclease of restriction endonuclease-like (RecB) superfamily